MNATFDPLEREGRRSLHVACAACLRNWCPAGDRTLCDDCEQRAFILSALIGMSRDFARGILPAYLMEAASRHLTTGIDPEEMSGLIGIDPTIDSVREAIQARLVRERLG